MDIRILIQSMDDLQQLLLARFYGSANHFRLESETGTLSFLRAHIAHGSRILPNEDNRETWCDALLMKVCNSAA